MEAHELTALAANNIRDLLQKTGMTQVQLAELTGLKQPDVSRLLGSKNKDRVTSLATLTRIAAAFNTTVDTLTGHPTLLLGTIAAGPNDSPITYNEPEIVTFDFPIPKDGYALRVCGHSCSRWGICHDDVIAIRQQNEPQEGAFCVLRSSGGSHTLKAYSRGKWWQFRPTDAEPVEYVFDAATNMFGVVIGGKYGHRSFATIGRTQTKKPKTK